MKTKYEIISSLLPDLVAYTDKQIAKYLIKNYPMFKETRLESLRRYICSIRHDLDIHKDTSEAEKLFEDIKIYLEKYKGDSVISIATRLQLNHKSYTANTIKTYLNDYAHWGKSKVKKSEQTIQ